MCTYLYNDYDINVTFEPCADHSVSPAVSFSIVNRLEKFPFPYHLILFFMFYHVCLPMQYNTPSSYIPAGGANVGRLLSSTLFA